MGVPTFYKWLSVKYPRVVTDAVEGTPLPVEDLTAGSSASDVPQNGHFDNLYLDMNGIIHPCSHPENGEAPSTEDEMFSRIFAYVDRIVDVVQPQKLLYLAIDGVAPRAKMNQQRTRRFKAASEVAQELAMYEDLRQQFESEGRSVPARPAYWDSNVITPGTPFLCKLSRALHYYINDRMSKVPLWTNLKVILSDANCPGEGEHKIMQYIRAQRTFENYNPNLRHCLHGADADLIMLGLATHEPHFYILREAVLEQGNTKKCFLCGRSDHLAADCTNDPVTAPSPDAADYKSSWKPLQFLSIPILKEYLAHEFAFTDTPHFEPDLERCVDDFVMMCFFVGNDFLPHLPSLSIHKGSIDQMILLYQKLRPTLSDYLTNAGELNLPQLQSFVEFLGAVEQRVFIEELKRQERIEQRKQEARQASSKASSADNATERSDETDQNFSVLQQLKRILTEGGAVSSPNKRLRYQSTTANPPAASQHEQDIDTFKALIRQKRNANAVIENPSDDVKLGVGSTLEWKMRYYQTKFNFKSCDYSDLQTLIKKVATAYTEGLRWVLAYYYQGVCSWNWFFPYHYAPFASDIAKYGIADQKPFSLGKPFRPFHQLMAVLPPQSGHCLPSQYASLMADSNSPILDFYPIKFKEDPDGKRYKWQWVVLLPFIDQARLLTALEPLEQSLNEEERQRNAEGADCIFVSRYNPLASQLSLVQLGQTPSEMTQVLKVQLSDRIAGEVSKSPTGFTTGVCVTAPHCSRELFPPKESVIVSCKFRCVAQTPHLCRLLPGAEPPPATLTPDHFQLGNDDSRSRQFNAAAAKRMIIGCLGRHGLVSQQEMDKYFYHPRSNGKQHNRFNANGPFSDNRYQVEMFSAQSYSTTKHIGLPQNVVHLSNTATSSSSSSVRFNRVPGATFGRPNAVHQRHDVARDCPPSQYPYGSQSASRYRRRDEPFVGTPAPPEATSRDAATARLFRQALPNRPVMILKRSAELSHDLGHHFQATDYDPMAPAARPPWAASPRQPPLAVAFHSPAAPYASLWQQTGGDTGDSASLQHLPGRSNAVPQRPFVPGRHPPWRQQQPANGRPRHPRGAASSGSVRFPNVDYRKHDRHQENRSMHYD